MNTQHYLRLPGKAANMRDFRLRKNKLREKIRAAEETRKELAEMSGGRYYVNILDDLRISPEYLHKIADRFEYNDIFADYYLRRSEELGDETMKRVSEAIRNCHKAWFFRWFQMQGVKDCSGISLCHNKFCSNCQHLLQQARVEKYTPILNELLKTNDLYHIVLTVPNVVEQSAISLGEKVNDILKSFKALIRYLNSFNKIAGIDFSQYGYKGAIRSLECTVKTTGFHPHLHSIFVLRKGLNFEKKHINKYSFDSHGVLNRKFSDFEILLQRLWRLLIDRERVTLEKINATKLGYSCCVDFISKDYSEVFKYITKTTKEDNAGEILTYKQFCTIEEALYHRRAVQGYGCLYNMAETENEAVALAYNIYKTVIGRLFNFEKPITSSMTYDEFINDVENNKNIKIISKRSILQFVENGGKDIRQFDWETI